MYQLDIFEYQEQQQFLLEEAFYWLREESIEQERLANRTEDEIYQEYWDNWNEKYMARIKHEASLPRKRVFEPITFESWFRSINWNEEDGDPRAVWNEIKPR